MLYIMRHGKTDWNAVHKLQGKTDVPLSGEGREMVEKAGRLYRDTHFDVCFCSPLIRARETAEIILRGRNIPIIEDVRLEEMGFGVCEGCTWIKTRTQSGRRKAGATRRRRILWISAPP